MKEKFIFREMLKEIREIADQKGNVLTEEEVRSFFEDACPQEEQMKLIFDYLTGQNIRILGYEEKETEDPAQQEEGFVITAQEESEYLSIYEEELQNIQEASDEEKWKLISSAAEGDVLAKSRLIELYLPTVAKIARKYEKKELPLADLIQEGNVGLMLAADALEKSMDMEKAECFLTEQIKKSIEEAIAQQRDTRRAAEEIAGRVNYLNEAIHNLEEDLEHKVSLEELSAYLEMPADEIEDILRMAGDEIEMETHSHAHPHKH